MTKTSELTKFEQSRILSARALELAGGAEPKVKIPKGKVLLSRDYAEIAKEELEKGLLELEIYKDI